MKKVIIFIAILIGVVFSAYANDLIVLRDGNIIEARVVEVHLTEIRYRRIQNLTGPIHVIPINQVLSIRYENGVVDIIGASGSPSIAGAPDTGMITQGAVTSMLAILNTLPAIPIAGNNLKFMFGDDGWTATVNGENFSAGTIQYELTPDGALLTLRQTHIWPGAIGKTAGRVASRIPGGGAVGSVLDTAGRVAGVAGAIEAAGPEIILEYKEGPPPRLSLVRSAAPSDRRERGDRRTSDNAQTAAVTRFDLDGFNVFAISATGMPIFPVAYGGGGSITLFERYKPNSFLNPSFFLAGRFICNDINITGYGDSGSQEFIGGGLGVLFKHRFPKDRVLWNVGGSLEFMLAFCNVSGVRYNYMGTGGSTDSASVGYDDASFLFGMGVQTGFSFRLARHLSLDINGVFKFPFGRVDMTPPSSLGRTTTFINSFPARISYWPFSAGLELGLTLWFPYKSRQTQ